MIDPQTQAALDDAFAWLEREARKLDDDVRALLGYPSRVGHTTKRVLVDAPGGALSLAFDVADGEAEGPHLDVAVAAFAHVYRRPYTDHEAVRRGHRFVVRETGAITGVLFADQKAAAARVYLRNQGYTADGGPAAGVVSSLFRGYGVQR